MQWQLWQITLIFHLQAHNTMKEIKAKQGHFLTQVAEVGENRIFVTAIKGANVDESQWREATAQEKEEFEKQQTQEA